jgi:hypothetical protein
MPKCDTIGVYHADLLQCKRLTTRGIDMDNPLIKETIEKIVSISEALEDFCNDPKNYNSYGSLLLERISLELYRQASQLDDFQHKYGF